MTYTLCGFNKCRCQQKYGSISIKIRIKEITCWGGFDKGQAFIYRVFLTQIDTKLTIENFRTIA